MLSIPPLLADVEGLIKITIGIIAFIFWIAKLVSQNQQGNAPAPAPARGTSRSATRSTSSSARLRDKGRVVRNRARDRRRTKSNCCRRTMSKRR